jgi:PPOX class probable F420-dependent enzyme
MTPAGAAGPTGMVPIPDDVRALLAAPNLAHIATLVPDGAPHTVPVWVDVQDDHIRFLTSPGSRKARNLARDPRLALSVADRERPNVMAHVRGRIVGQVDGEEGWAIIDAMSERYIGRPHPVREDRVVYLVKAERAWAQER